MKKELFVLLMASALGVTTTELDNAYGALKNLQLIKEQLTDIKEQL